ncbi:MAG: hypothetical protein AAF215_17365 [Cyanobacteria bacterium P01_A01_bin.123]
MKNWYGSDFKRDAQRLALKRDRVNSLLKNYALERVKDSIARHCCNLLIKLRSL